jgi:hypothetical protein
MFLFHRRENTLSVRTPRLHLVVMANLMSIPFELREQILEHALPPFEVDNAWSWDIPAVNKQLRQEMLDVIHREYTVIVDLCWNSHEAPQFWREAYRARSWAASSPVSIHPEQRIDRLQRLRHWASWMAFDKLEIVVSMPAMSENIEAAAASLGAILQALLFSQNNLNQRKRVCICLQPPESHSTDFEPVLNIVAHWLEKTDTLTWRVSSWYYWSRMNYNGYKSKDKAAMKRCFEENIRRRESDGELTIGMRSSLAFWNRFETRVVFYPPP